MARQLYPHICDYLLHISNVYTSLWKASELNRQRLQGTLPSVNYKRKLHWNQLYYSQLLHLIGWVKSNQNFFDPKYERYATLEGYDQINQYYLSSEGLNSDDDDSV